MAEVVPEDIASGIASVKENSKLKRKKRTSSVAKKSANPRKKSIKVVHSQNTTTGRIRKP